MYAWSVRINGGEIRDLVLDGRATITYGRQSIDTQPEPTAATINVLTSDAAPDLFYRFPGFYLNPALIPSGFVQEWRDQYEGTSTQLVPGATVEIDVEGESGFVNEWDPQYRGTLAQTRRFTGYVHSIDYTPGTISVLCVTSLEAVSRVLVTDTFTAATDTVRVEEIALHANTTIHQSGAAGVNLVEWESTGEPATALLRRIAETVEGTLWTDRENRLQFRYRTGWTPAQVTLPPRHVLVDPIVMSIDLSKVENVVDVTYGVADQTTGQRPIVTATNSASVTDHGHRMRALSTLHADAAAAQGFADRWVAGHVLAWSMPSVQVLLADADEATIGAIANLEIGDEVTVPNLLPGSPDQTYTARLLGYVETLSRQEWTMRLHVTPESYAEGGSL